MSELTKLPERWAILRNSKNHKKINEWFNAKFPQDGGYRMNCGFMHNHNVKKLKFKLNSDFGKADGFTEITFEQFMDWVYIPWKTAKEADGWIRCSERMPKQGALVFVWLNVSINYGGMAIYTGDDDWMYSDVSTNFFTRTEPHIQVTHWRELPSVPKDLIK